MEPLLEEAFAEAESDDHVLSHRLFRFVVMNGMFPRVMQMHALLSAGDLINPRRTTSGRSERRSGDAPPADIVTGENFLPLARSKRSRERPS